MRRELHRGRRRRGRRRRAFPSSRGARLPHRPRAGSGTRAKHARAQRIAIEIAAREQTLYGVVHDDGVGFDPASVRERPDRHLHLGLDAIEQRVVLAGGTLEIDSAPMRGARVYFAIPVAAA